MARGKVLLDIDGVMFDMMGFVRDELAKDGVTFKPEEVATYSLRGNIGCDRKLVYPKFKSTNLHVVDYTYEGCFGALLKLQKYVDVYAYTLAFPESLPNRNNYLKGIGVIGEAMCNSDVKSKPVLRGFMAVFEDKPDIVQKYADIEETTVYIIEQTYNKDCSTHKDFPTAVDAFLRENKFID